jgi:hypothetical protein
LSVTNGMRNTERNSNRSKDNAEESRHGIKFGAIYNAKIVTERIQWPGLTVVLFGYNPADCFNAAG